MSQLYGLKFPETLFNYAKLTTNFSFHGQGSDRNGMASSKELLEWRIRYARGEKCHIELPSRWKQTEKSIKHPTFYESNKI